MIKPGIYRHFKGGRYQVVGVARHSETEEEMVVYRQMYDDGSWWVRPLTHFTESVIRQGCEVGRFVYERDMNDLS